MALYPCSRDGLRYRGPSQAAYPAIVKGRDSEREHLRLCGPHFDEFYRYCGKHLEKVEYDQPGPVQESFPVCAFCGGALADERLVFVTAYPQGQEETQFYGRVGGCCVAKARQELLLTH